MKFLILSTTNQPLLQEAIKAAGHEYERAAPADFQMYLSNKTSGYDAVYRGSKPVTRKSFECVIPRLGGRDRAYGARLLKHLRLNLGIFTCQSGYSSDVCSDKWISSQLFSAAKLRTPAQFFCKEVTDFEFIVKKLGGLPIIAKPAVGTSQGTGVLKLETEESASLVLEYLHKTDQKFILQEYIETSTTKHGGQDIRLIVIGNQVVNAMKRTAPKNKLRANLSIDATGEKYTPTKEIEEMAIKAVEVIEGLNFGGVDIMLEPHPDGDIPYLIEVNSNPGSKVVDITGHNHFEDVVQYCIEQAPLFKRAFDAYTEKRTAGIGTNVSDQFIETDGKSIGQLICETRDSLNFIFNAYPKETDRNLEIEKLEQRLGKQGAVIVTRTLEAMVEGIAVNRTDHTIFKD